MHKFDLPLAKGEPSPREKVRQVMLAFKDGHLRANGGKDANGNPRPGPVITNRKQAIAVALAQTGLKKAFEENDHPRGEDGKFTAADTTPAKPWTIGEKLSLAIPASIGALGGVNSALVHGISPRGLSAVQRLKVGGKAGAIAAGVTAAGLALPTWAIHDGIALATGRKDDAFANKTWGGWAGDLPYAVIAGTLAASGARGAGRMLATQAEAAPMLARLIGGRIVPAYGRHLAEQRTAVLRGIRQTAKAVPGRMVWRGAPGSSDFNPVNRNYNAVYAATRKKVTGTYGKGSNEVGAVTAYRLHPDAKLLDTHVRLPGDDGKKPPITALFGLWNKTNKPADPALVPLYEQLLGEGERNAAGLSNLHVAPTTAQVQTLKDAGYDGTIGSSKNVALHHPELLTPLYAQSRYSGGLKFPKAAPVAKLAKSAPANDHHNACDERVAGMMPHADRLLRQAGKVHSGGAAEPHVAQMMPHVHRLLGTVVVPTPRSRLQNNAQVGNHRLPLAQIVA